MKLNIDNNTTTQSGLGRSIHQYLKDNKHKEIITIIFTKGKLEINVEEVERVNIYEDSMIIYYKDKNNSYVNLLNITQII